MHPSWLIALLSAAVLNTPVLAESARNERSTPRDSILPVSPAIAPSVQVSTGNLDYAFIQRAKAYLAALGYDVGRFDGHPSAKLKAAVFRYQQARGLPPSGELDAATLTTLGLSAQ
jgi:peptidoglycan hydrolase-like protein with peptidoglycan-binding domain